MPLYTYKCPSCAQQRLVTKSMFDTAIEFCDDCEVEMRKVFGVAKPIFKGEGFYTTDKFTNR